MGNTLESEIILKSLTALKYYEIENQQILNSMYLMFRRTELLDNDNRKAMIKIKTMLIRLAHTARRGSLPSH